MARAVRSPKSTGPRQVRSVIIISFTSVLKSYQLPYGNVYTLSEQPSDKYGEIKSDVVRLHARVFCI